jgi:hypothetical protein
VAVRSSQLLNHSKTQNLVIPAVLCLKLPVTQTDFNKDAQMLLTLTPEFIDAL